MANRIIPFGYEIKNNVVAIAESEAEVVRNIFAEYINGKSLKDIALELTQRKVTFYKEKNVWNKARVFRILENDKYTGTQGYPEIISAEMFSNANTVKYTKGYTVDEHSNVAEFLKSKLYCGNCGERLFRKSCSGGSDRWQCVNGCKSYTISKDKALRCFAVILEKVKCNPELLNVSDEEPTYVKTPEIMRYCNEIGMMTNGRQPSFVTVKKLILQYATVKFNACRENRADIYTDYICKQFAHVGDSELLSVDFLRRVVDRVLIISRNNLAVEFVNGAVIKYGETNGTK